MNLMVVFIPTAIVLLLLVGSSARMVQQYEQGIVVELLRFFDQATNTAASETAHVPITPAAPTTPITAPPAASVVLPDSPAALSQSNGDRS